MVRIITLSSGKGGTGKTLVTANLGVALAQLGKKTLVLDADVTMANLGLVFGIEERKTNLHEVLSGGGAMKNLVYNGPAGLKIVPCGMSLDGIRRAKLERLKNVVTKLASGVDIMLIDSASGLDHDAITALSVAQEVILVVTPNFTAVAEATKIKVVAERLSVKPVGVVINRATGERTDLSRNEIVAVLDLPVLGIIPEDAEVRRAAALGEPVVTRSPKSPATKAFKELASKILKTH